MTAPRSTSATDDLLSPEMKQAGELRQLLQRGRAEVRDFHHRGGNGTQVTAALTALCDRVLSAAYDWVDEQTGRRDRVANELTLVAVGGYGRGDLAPFSDVDLLFLTTQPDDELIRKFVSSLVRLLWDAGLSISQSVRTPSGCIEFAKGDLPAWTALTEARYLRGNIPLFKQLRGLVDHQVRRAPIRSLVRKVLEERGKEQEDYHTSSAYLLEPNLKKSAGGLRDIHLMRWIGRARYGVADTAQLFEMGKLSERDYLHIEATREYLLRLRNEMHFVDNSAHDVLTLHDQVQLSKAFGFQDEGGVLGVERFMQQYYRHTGNLHEAVMQFVEAAAAPRGSRWFRSFSRRKLDPDFVVEGDRITVTPAALPRVTQDAERLLRLFELARCYGVRVSPEQLTAVKVGVPTCEVTPAARKLFMGMLGNPLGLAEVLRSLHSVGLLGRLIPPFERVRCLIQFNQYHKYTVDEHTLRAIEAATGLMDDRSPLGHAYRQIRRKDLLHWTLLLHDIGKGQERDHSEIGHDIALELSPEFGLNDHDRELVAFLIRHHLLMANTSQRRDLGDEETILQFARTVRTPEALRMLFVHTAADTEAVAPGNRNSWKDSLLIELYLRTMREISDEDVDEEEASHVAQVRGQVLSEWGSRSDDPWLDEQIRLMPGAYLMTTPPPRIASHLRGLKAYTPGSVHVESFYTAQTGVSTYTVYTGDGLRRGIFANIAGVLASAGFQIFSAQIVTRADGVVLDTFEGRDLDYAAEPPASRRTELAAQIVDVLTGKLDVAALMGRRKHFNAGGPRLNPRPTQVEIDNETSERFTIVEVFADDRQGLLYVIAQALSDFGLSVHSAKIATHIDQVVDVFYVTDGAGAKVTDDTLLDGVRTDLVRRIHAFEVG